MTEDDVLKTRLNAETGRIAWQELQRHFARGVVVKVELGIDLVDVAVYFTNDNKQAVAHLMEAGQVARASDEDARIWQMRDTQFWALVVAPWVLVQEIQ